MNELDLLLVDYLDQLSLYQQLNTSLNATLKTSFFQLSQAKLATNPLRLSSLSYDLSDQHKAQRLVSISDDGNASFSLHKRPPPPSSQSDSEESTPTLRQRTNLPSTSTTSSSDEKPPTKKQPPPFDPLHQFSALPPPALKNSQASFGKSLELVLRLLEVKMGLDELEKKVEKTRRNDGKEVKGRGEGEEEGDKAAD